MKWKAKPIIQRGDHRKRLKFAWKPTLVEDYTVWLEYYGVQEVFDLKAWSEGDDIHCKEVWTEVDRYIPVWYY